MAQAKHPIPLAALDDRLGFVGTAGSGKTYNAGSGVERILAANGRVVIPDPLGVWWGLALSADGQRPAPWREKGRLVIFGGEHGDMPLTEQAGALIGETVAGMAESAILDLSGLGTKASEVRFMLAFLTALYRHANVEPVHLIFDEADMWAPQVERDKGEAPKLLGMMETVVRRGRIKGFIPWLITQRPAVLNKNVLSQVDGLVAFKLTSSQDRAALGAWIEGQADRAAGREILDSLPTLPRGTGVIWAPARGILETAAFPAKVTFDSSRTPTRGERVERKELKPLDLDKLKGKLASLEEEQKANDPRALKAKILDVSRELARTCRELEAERKKVPLVPQVAVNEASEWRDRAKAAEARAITAEGKLAKIARLVQSDFDRCGISEKPTRVIRESAAAAKPSRVAGDFQPVDGSVPAGCAKPLATLAGVYPAGMTEAQWATAAGYKRSGGTWSTYKSRLRAAAMVERRDGKFFATEAGAQAVGDVEVPPTPGPDLVRWWAAKLPGTSRVAEALIEAWPNGLSKDELAARIGMTASGGSFSTYLSRLASPGIITRDGEIRLAPEAMGGA